MKKTFRKIMALTACALLVFNFNACDDDNDSGDPTKAMLKSVASVTDCSMVVNAEISGDEEVAERGVFVSPDSITEGKAKFLSPVRDAKSGIGFFSLTVGKLTPETKYFVCAYAKNKKGVFTLSDLQTAVTNAVKSEQTKTVLKSIASVTDSSMVVNAEISGDEKVAERGILISEEAITLANARDLTPVKDAKAGNGFFTLTLGKLKPETKYFVRAYAKNEKGDLILSEPQTAVTNALNLEPTKVVVKSIASITDCSMIVNVEVTGEVAVVERGLFISESLITMEAAKSLTPVKDAGVGGGFYTLALEKLKPETTYYISAYAKNAEGELTLSEQQMAVTSISAKVSIVSSSVTDHTISIAASVVGNDVIVSRGIYFSKSPISESDFSILTPVFANEAGIGEFSLNFEGLCRNTEYHAVAFAKSEGGAFTYSEEFVVKTTKDEPAYIKLDATSTETSVTATFVSNDPVIKVGLKKGEYMKELPFKEGSVEKDGIYYYSVSYTDLEEANFVFAVMTEFAKEEAKTGTGRFVFGYVDGKVTINDGDVFHFVHGDIVGTIKVEAILNGSIDYRLDGSPKKMLTVTQTMKHTDKTELILLSYEKEEKYFYFDGMGKTLFYRVK